MYEEFREIVGASNVIKGEYMRLHTSFKIGGRADCFVTPQNADTLEKVINICKECGYPYFVMGNGTNLLVSDDGFRGVVIKIGKSFATKSNCGETITAGAGMLLSRLAGFAESKSLTGLEFASGIPGTVGGAVVMNAGAYGGEMKDVVESVKAYSYDKGIVKFEANELNFGYRTSIFKYSDLIVLETVFKLKKAKNTDIVLKMEELRSKRNAKQPLDYPSAGSVFKRPEGYFAGKLISDAGLSGFSVGSAKVSEKHSGFIINTGCATASDVKRLIDIIIERVYNDSGVTLEPEVLFLGEF